MSTITFFHFWKSTVASVKITFPSWKMFHSSCRVSPHQGQDPAGSGEGWGRGEGRRGKYREVSVSGVLVVIHVGCLLRRAELHYTLSSLSPPLLVYRNPSKGISHGFGHTPMLEKYFLLFSKSRVPSQDSLTALTVLRWL
jgi:hypothetical protein